MQAHHRNQLELEVAVAEGLAERLAVPLVRVYHGVLLLPKGMVARCFLCVCRVDGVSCCLAWLHSCRCAAKMLSGLQALLGAKNAVVDPLHRSNAFSSERCCCLSAV